MNKKHGVKCTKRDVVEDSFYLLEVYQKSQVIGEGSPFRTIANQSKFVLIDCLNRLGLSMYNFQLFKISKLKL